MTANYRVVTQEGMNSGMVIGGIFRPGPEAFMRRKKDEDGISIQQSAHDLCCLSTRWADSLTPICVQVARLETAEIQEITGLDNKKLDVVPKSSGIGYVITDVPHTPKRLTKESAEAFKFWQDVALELAWISRLVKCSKNACGLQHKQLT
ncbi:hypothetical protein IT575_15545 [bacterium]|nr:hypothetical protein [bacterium]